MGCCTGFEGSDCRTRKKWLLCDWNLMPFKHQLTNLTNLCLVAICQTPCEPGYMCTSPDDCTVDTTLIGEFLSTAWSFLGFFHHTNIQHINKFQALRTPPSIPILRSMKLPVLLLNLVIVPVLSQVKLSTSWCPWFS